MTNKKYCPRCIEDYEDEETGEYKKGTKKVSKCDDCGVCKDCEHMSDCMNGIAYGDYADVEDDALNRMRERLMDYIEKGKSKKFIRKFHELMEVERELTLREEDPR